MISYSISRTNNHSNKEITSILANVPLSRTCNLEVELISFGAGIRRISYIDRDKDINKLLTLSYADIFESCQNSSLAGLTIGPNAGRLPAWQDIVLKDETSSVTVNLPANEDDTKQIHGGSHNLSSIDWNYMGVSASHNDEEISFIFSCSQEEGVDGWPGNRKYEVVYTLSSSGTINIFLKGETDKKTYINMTNHTYWLRNSLTLEVMANSFIVNHDDFLPKAISNLDSDMFSVTDNAVLNNAFILNSDCAARISYSDIPLAIDLCTDAPALVVYTGDYLDSGTLLYGGKHSSPSCAIALEAQELYPFTPISIISENKSFKRNIQLRFINTET